MSMSMKAITIAAMKGCMHLSEKRIPMICHGFVIVKCNDHKYDDGDDRSHGFHVAMPHVHLLMKPISANRNHAL